MLHWLRRTFFGEPVLVLVIGLSLTALATGAFWKLVTAKDSARFERNLGQALRDIDNRMSTYVAMMRGGVGLMAANREISGAQFAAYIEQLRLREIYPGIQGIGWSIVLTPEQKDSFEAAEHSRGRSDFRVWPEGPRDVYTTIAYLEPLDVRNGAAIGYDMFSDPSRRAAMERARDTGRASSTGRVELVQEIDAHKQPGFLIYLPVYRNHVLPTTVEQRRGALRGFIYGPFRADDLFANIFPSEETPPIRVRVYDGEPSSLTLLHDSAVGVTDAKPETARFSKTKTLRIANRDWTIVATSRPAFESGSSLSLVPVAALLGFLASVACAAITLGQARARVAAQREVRERRRSERLRATLLGELNHRVKNTLATVQSIARQTLKSERDPASFAHAFQGRLRALAGTHDLLSDSEWKGATLRQVIEAELAPHGCLEAGRCEVNGPNVTLQPRAALTLGLAFHELATNAAKHGALSASGGSVCVAWELTHRDDARRLIVTWRERNGPVVAAPARRGFGSRLIQQGVAHELRGDVDLSFHASGAECRFDLPLGMEPYADTELARPVASAAK